MTTSQLSDVQKTFILKQDDEGVPVAKICRKAGSATYFKEGVGRHVTAEDE